VWKKYENEQIVSSLNIAFEDYLFRVQSHISFAVPRQFAYDLELAGNEKKQVLRGRELNGEPRDLDF